MAGNVLTESEFFAGDESAPQEPSTSNVVSADEFFGAPKVETPSVVSPIPEQHRVPLITKLGDAVYNGMLNTAIRAMGSVTGGVATINDFIGGLGLRAIPGYQENFVEPGQRQAQQAIEATPSENFFERSYYGLVSTLGSMVPTIPFDVVTGMTTKAALAGRILPVMEEMLSAIPDFALGSGWRGMVDGIEASGNPVEGVYKGPLQAGENVMAGTLFASSGVGLEGIGKMAAIGLASSFYEAGKIGRLPTKEEMVDGTTQGGLLGLVFTALPHLMDATQLGPEKVALKEYIGKAKGVKDPSELLQITDNLLHDERIRPEIRESLAQPFVDLLDKRGKVVAPDLEVGKWKDASTLSLLRETTERNIEGVAKADAPVVKEFTTERIKENETAAAKWGTANRQMLRGKMTEWGIEPNSLDDRLVMRYGEGRATLASVQIDSPKNWQNVVAASQWFRGQYDSLLDTINTVRARYEYDPILKRDDYFRHFQELSAASNVFGFLLGGKNPPTTIAGIVKKPKPGKPFTPVELQRLGGKFVESAIGGFDNYIRVAQNQIFHTDSVQRMRMLSNYIRGQAESNDKIDLANFMTNLEDYTNILAGQPNDFDRTVQRTFGRPAYAVLRWLKNRTSANMIAGNISAAMSNLIVLTTQAPATMDKMMLAKGIFTSTLTPFDKNFFKIDGVESGLFARRYPDHRVALTFWDKGADMSGAFFQAIDQFTVKAMLAGKYHEGRDQGLTPEQAMKAADNYTSRAVQDRSKGQLPVLMESKALGAATQFQVEVNNMVSFLQKDIPQQYHGDIKKIVSSLAQFAVYSWVFNNLFEEIAGRRPTIDPVYMLATLAGVNKAGRARPFTERIFPAAKEFASSLPFGNLFMDGGRFPISSGIPNAWNIAKDPTLRTTWEEVSKPLFYFAPPFGGGQLKKTIDGMTDFTRGVSETPSGDERYGITRNIRNFLQGFIFGKNSFPEAVRYWSQPKDER